MKQVDFNRSDETFGQDGPVENPDIGYGPIQIS